MPVSPYHTHPARCHALHVAPPDAWALYLFWLIAAFWVMHGNIVSMPARTAAASPAINNASPQGPTLTGFIAVQIDKAEGVGVPLQYWQGIMERHDPEKAFGVHITALSTPVLQQWKNLAKRMPTWTSEQKLQYINGFFNRWDSKSDYDNYAVEEFWASPEEFLENGGDCEDYSIIKYLALRYFGWPEENLWILLLKENKTGNAHAALAAKTGEKTFILDNLSRPVYLLIPEAQYLQTFTPVYALNHCGAWVLTRPVPGGNNERKALGSTD